MRVFVTGASSGLGQALARYYAQSGATLGLVARGGSALEELARELQVPSVRYAIDVRDCLAMQSAASDFIARFGCPDIVIASAGVSCGNLTEYAEDSQTFQTILDINVMGTVNTFQPFIVAMRDIRHGALVGIGSVAGIRGLPGASAYSASKAALMVYLEGLRVELAGTGIHVTTACPGYIKTAMTAVNPYPMPFILSAETAARKIANAITHKRRLIVLPWQMAIVASVLKHLPDWVYDLVFAHAPHKPRNLPL